MIEGVRMLGLLSQETNNVGADLATFDRTICERVLRQRNTLLVGTELEVLLKRDRAILSQADHAFSVGEIVDELSRSTKTYSDDYTMGVSTVGRSTIEVRSPAMKLSQYAPWVEEVVAKVASLALNFGVAPGIYSQHIHLSLVSGQKNFADPLFTYNSMKHCFDIGALSAYIDAYPLLVSSSEYSGIKGLGRPTRERGRNPQHKDPFRIEHRLLSSEDFWNPGLNLYVALTAQYEGLKCVKNALKGGISNITHEKSIEKIRRHDIRVALEEFPTGILSSDLSPEKSNLLREFRARHM